MATMSSGSAIAVTILPFSSRRASRQNRLAIPSGSARATLRIDLRRIVQTDVLDGQMLGQDAAEGQIVEHVQSDEHVAQAAALFPLLVERLEQFVLGDQTFATPADRRTGGCCRFSTVRDFWLSLSWFDRNFERSIRSYD